MPKQIIHKIFAVLLSFLIVASSLTITLEKHLCVSGSCTTDKSSEECCATNHNSDFELFTVTTENHSTCSENCCNRKDCCTTVITTIEGIKIYQHHTDTNKFKSLKNNLLHQIFKIYSLKLPYYSRQKFEINRYQPPDFFFNHNIVFRVFRI